MRIKKHDFQIRTTTVSGNLHVEMIATRKKLNAKILQEHHNTKAKYEISHALDETKTCLLAITESQSKNG